MIIVVDCVGRFPTKFKAVEIKSVDDLLKSGALPGGPVLCLVHGSNMELAEPCGAESKVSVLCKRICQSGGHVVFFSGNVPDDTTWLATLDKAGLKEGTDYSVRWRKLPEDLISGRVAVAQDANGGVDAEKPTDLLVGTGGGKCLQVLRALLPLDIILQGVRLSANPQAIPYFPATPRENNYWFCASELIDPENGDPFSWEPAVVEAAVRVLGEGQSEGKFVQGVIHPSTSLERAKDFSLSRADDVGALRLVWEWVKAGGQTCDMRDGLGVNETLRPENLPVLLLRAHEEFTKLIPKITEAARRVDE